MIKYPLRTIRELVGFALASRPDIGELPLCAAHWLVMGVSSDSIVHLATLSRSSDRAELAEAARAVLEEVFDIDPSGSEEEIRRTLRRALLQLIILDPENLPLYGEALMGLGAHYYDAGSDLIGDLLVLAGELGEEGASDIPELLREEVLKLLEGGKV